MDGFVLLVPLGVLMGSWVIGRAIERSHYRSIRVREQASHLRPVLTSKRLPDDRPVRWTKLAVGSVVTGADYFKAFVSGFRQIFGGEMHAYGPVLDRARREAVLRMKESCPSAHAFVNCRFETSQIGGERRQIPLVEVIAYSTAVYFADEPADEVRSPRSG